MYLKPMNTIHTSRKIVVQVSVMVQNAPHSYVKKKKRERERNFNLLVTTNTHLSWNHGIVIGSVMVTSS